jgi:histidine triad (HIT) family protein
MNNPLNEEQIRKISEIAKLPQDQQQVTWDSFVKTLNEEQIEFLRNQQQTSQCIFCAISQNKLPAKKVYEDDNFVAVLDIKPANKGHVVVIPKKHYPVSAIMPENELAEMFVVSNNVAKAIFETVKAEGTNILLANGAVAGQLSQHVVVHVIPRFKDDKVSVKWDPIQVNEDEMNKIAEDLSSRLGMRIRQSAEKPVVVQDRIDQQPEGEEDLREYELDKEREP